MKWNCIRLQIFYELKAVVIYGAERNHVEPPIDYRNHSTRLYDW
jgi:hypothetical protein